MKEEFVTKNHFDKTISNIDRKFDEKFSYLEEKIDSVLEAINYGFEQNAKEHNRLDRKIDNVSDNVDALAKSKVDSDVEFTVLKHRVDVIEEKVGV